MYLSEMIDAVESKTGKQLFSSEEERKAGKLREPLDKERIYKMVSANKKQAFFIKSEVASTIIDKYEFSASNKQERALSGEMIKEICIPIKVDRLGHIIKIGI